MAGAAAAFGSNDGCASRPGRCEALSGSEAAFTVVFAAHHQACLRLARRLVRDDGLAQEVVQEVFLSWWRDPGGYRPDRGELAAWLSTLTHHKAVDAVRTSERHRRLVTAAGSQLQCQPEQRLVEEVVWWELGRQSLSAALPTLTAVQREVLDLAYVTGLTQTEIAERLGIPLGTVKSRTHAGMLRLRAAIGGTWTPTVPDGAVAPDHRRPTGSATLPDGASGTSPPPDTRVVREDAQQCAAVLITMAVQEHQDSLDSAALVSAAAALAAKHGQVGMYELVVALARQAAARAAAGQAPVVPVHLRVEDQGDAGQVVAAR